MLNNILYTGTGVAVASLSAAYYYVYSTRINANKKQVYPELVVGSTPEEESLGNFSNTVYEDCVSEVSVSVAEGSLSDPTGLNSFSLLNFQSQASSTPSTQFISLRESTSNESLGSIAPLKIHSTPTPRLVVSSYMLKTNLQSLITGNGSKHGLNIMKESASASEETSMLIPRTPSRSRKDSGSSFEIGQIVSRTELSTPPSRSRPITIYEEIPEEPENAADGDHGDHDVNDSGMKTSGLKPLSLAPFPTETSTCASQTNFEESTIPLHRTDSPVVFYTNARFGERYACKDSEQLTLSALLKNSTVQPHEHNNPGPSKIVTQKHHTQEFDKPANRLSVSESFQQILQRKRKHLRPVGERKSEGMIPEFQHDASAQTDTLDAVNLGHKDSTLFLFPPVLSESRMSVEENDSEHASNDQSEENAEMTEEPRAGTSEFDVNNNDGPEQQRQGVGATTSESRVRKRKHPGEEVTTRSGSASPAPIVDAEKAEPSRNAAADDQYVADAAPAVPVPTSRDQLLKPVDSTSWTSLCILAVLVLALYFVLAPIANHLISF